MIFHGNLLDLRWLPKDNAMQFSKMAPDFVVIDCQTDYYANGSKYAACNKCDELFLKLPYN